MEKTTLYGGVNVDEAEAEQLRYIYQRIGFQCFRETLSEDAGKHLFEGGLNPRVLVSYYPHLRGAPNTADYTINLFAGVAEHMPPESSVEDIIAANLVRNYSPHLFPKDFLRKWRTRRVLESQGRGGQTISSNREDECAAVDTVLVKLFARNCAFARTSSYHCARGRTHVEPMLVENGQYNALCELLQQAGDHENLLDVWSKLITGGWSDEGVSDPVVTMVTYLTNLNERPDKSSTFAQITQKWALWLMHEKRAPEQGLKVCFDACVLAYLLLTKPPHTFRPLYQAHRQFPPPSPPLLPPRLSHSYPTSVPRLLIHLRNAPDSRTYCNEAIIGKHKPLLSFDLEILESKLGNHRAVLECLVRDVGDGVSAEAYCAVNNEPGSNGGRQVISTHVCRIIADTTEGLRGWKDVVIATAETEISNEALVQMLLEVYMSVDDEEKHDQSATIAATAGCTPSQFSSVTAIPSLIR
ncbi:hypothetical protein DFH05DRAFT_1531452 [Lentinula detonsa]|uniref:Vacuolar sorting protein 39/Transforming growth factor beta receptor-associated domain-containing protein n=1 Tax=Lentinula detonsa TaxID=2804962 RepID=A0A9W8TR58_9AGAR|nr:hypothetical protein DFH05DRAFT_1531452 [Lentinula detonsa]